MGTGAGNKMVRIIAIKCGNQPGYVRTSAMIQGIYYAVKKNADVISISSGSYYRSEAYGEAIDYAYRADVAIVASAGNGSTNEKHYPSDYPHVISVAATTKNNKKAEFSNYGNSIDIAAPGVNIFSCMPGNKYGEVSGTSFSAPIVSATVAMMRACNSSLTVAEIEKILEAKATKINVTNIGSGLVNSGLAIQEARYRLFANNKESLTSVTALNLAGTIKLNWNGASDADGYQIYRSTQKDGTYEKIKTITNKSTLSYKDTGLTKNKTYYYKVRGYMKYDIGKKYCQFSNIKAAKSK